MADVLGDLTAQLHRVEIAYAGMQLYDETSLGKPYRETLIPLRRFVTDTLNDLPTSDRERLALTLPGHLGDVRGDTFQLAFVLQTLAIHLLEAAPPNETVRVRAEILPGRVRFVLEASTDTAGEEYASGCTLLQARGRSALRRIEETLRRFIENHGGTFEEPAEGSAGSTVRYSFVLPTTVHTRRHA